ncbi:MAG: glycosyltransferase family 39 protein [Candidatus Gottesmanbacteria bacterium]
MKAKIFTTISLIVIAILSILLRLYKLNGPIADWHSWRQADTAAVARNYLRFGIDLLHPRYDDLSNIQSGKDNPQGYRMVEFPLYQAAAAGLSKTFGMVSVEVWLRILAIIASTITGIALGMLVWRRINAITGVLTALLYAILPYSVYYGRAILPDGVSVCFAVLSLLLFDYGNDAKTKKGKWILTLVSAALAGVSLLIKPVAGFVLLPLAGMLFVGKKQFLTTVIRLAVYSVIVLVPFILWRNWMQQYPEGIPVYQWLFNNNNIRFKGAWFYWLFAERIGKLILGYWGTMFLGLGMLGEMDKKERLLSPLLFVGALLYMVIIAGGNVQHDYYQILILPAIVVYGAKGMAWCMKLAWEAKGLRKVSILVVSSAAFLFMLSFSWYTIRTFYWVNRPEIVEAGMAADKLLPKDAKVIAPYNGDTTFLYQTGRQGWPLGFDIEKKLKMGATHYVTVSPTDSDLETRDLANMYTVLVRNDKYAIIDLTKKK